MSPLKSHRWNIFSNTIRVVILWYGLNVAWSLYTLAHADLTRLTDLGAIKDAFFFPGQLANHSTPIWVDFVFVLLCIFVYVWTSKKPKEKQPEKYTKQPLLSSVTANKSDKRASVATDELTGQEIQEYFKEHFKMSTLSYRYSPIKR